TGVIALSSLRNLENVARSKLEREWNGAEPYRIRRSSSHWLEDPRQDLASFELLEPSDPAAFEIAFRALKSYGVLTPDGVLEPGDWRRREEVRHLPDADREELELWMMEQAFRYCLALGERPNSPEDWQRARNLIDHLTKLTPIPALGLLAQRLD